MAGRAVIPWPGHIRYHCPDTCTGCCICSGGLFSCTTCNGGEASLPQDCPGRPMTHQEQDDVAAGIADYRRREGWVLLDEHGQIVTSR